MPILGVIDSAKTGNLWPANSYFQIATTAVGSGGAASVTFSGIPSTYTHLQIRGFGRQTNTGSSTQTITMRFNSDSGSNYASHRILGENVSAFGQNSINATGIEYIGQWPLISSTANVFGATVIDILDYANTNKFKTIKSINGSDGNNSSVTDIGISSGLWRSTSAINSITLTATAFTGGFAQYSQFSLYGIMVS